MMRKILFFLVVSTAVTVISCNKSEILPPSAGTFVGTFTQVYDGEDTIAEGKLSMGLSDEKSTFFVQVDEGSLYPVSCYGEYSLASNKDIIFFKGPNMIVPEDDPLMILDTNYTFQFTDSTFHFDLITEDDYQYSYRMKRY